MTLNLKSFTCHANVGLPFVWAIAVLTVVLHAKVVSHFVGNSCGKESHRVGVPHVDPSGELVSTDRALQSFADHATFELDPCQQLGVVVRMQFQQFFLNQKKCMCIFKSSVLRPLH